MAFRLAQVVAKEGVGVVDAFERRQHVFGVIVAEAVKVKAGGIEFSSDGSLVAAISNDKGDLCLWNAVTGELLFRNADPAINPEMTAMRFCPDGSRIVTRGYYLIPGNTHTEVRVWDVEQMQNR